MSGNVALVAEFEIRQVLYRYCRGIDRMDRDLVRSCYHPGATDSHGSFSGTVDEFLDWVWRLLSRYEMTQHFVSNVLVSLTSESAAHVESYGMAVHRGDPAVPERNLVTGFRFVDAFRFVPDTGWRISSRIAVTEWSRPVSDWWPIPPGMVTGSRDRTDPVYRDT